jgi:hypothetical protein
MILKGKDLILTRNGIAIAACKSCEIDIAAQTIPVAHPTDGAWEHSISGRKSWQITSGHLLVSRSYSSGKLSACGTSHNNGSIIPPAILTMPDGQTISYSNRGFTVVVLHDSGTGLVVNNTFTYDTYDSETAVTNMIAKLNTLTATTDNVVAILSYDAITITSALQTAMATLLNVEASRIPTVSASRTPFAAIATTAATNSGTCLMGSPNSMSEVSMQLNGNAPVSDTPFKDMVLSVGNTYQLSVSVTGLYADRVSGSAICKQCKISSTIGNLAQGSFLFEGSGPLT